MYFDLTSKLENSTKEGFYLHHSKCWSLWYSSRHTLSCYHKMCSGWHHGFCSYPAGLRGSSHTPRQTCKRCGGKMLDNVEHCKWGNLHVNGQCIMDIFAICAIIYIILDLCSILSQALVLMKNWQFVASGQLALWDLYILHMSAPRLHQM